MEVEAFECERAVASEGPTRRRALRAELLVRLDRRVADALAGRGTDARSVHARLRTKHKLPQQCSSATSAKPHCASCAAWNAHTSACPSNSRFPLASLLRVHRESILLFHRCGAADDLGRRCRAQGAATERSLRPLRGFLRQRERKKSRYQFCSQLCLI